MHVPVFTSAALIRRLSCFVAFSSRGPGGFENCVRIEGGGGMGPEEWAARQRMARWTLWRTGE